MKNLFRSNVPLSIIYIIYSVNLNALNNSINISNASVSTHIVNLYPPDQNTSGQANYHSNNRSFNNDIKFFNRERNFVHRSSKTKKKVNNSLFGNLELDIDSSKKDEWYFIDSDGGNIPFHLWWDGYLETYLRQNNLTEENLPEKVRLYINNQRAYAAGLEKNQTLRLLLYPTNIYQEVPNFSKNTPENSANNYGKEFDLQFLSDNEKQRFIEAEIRYHTIYDKYINQEHASNRTYLAQRLYFHGIDLTKKMEYENYPRWLHIDFFKLGEFHDKCRYFGSIENLSISLKRDKIGWDKIFREEKNIVDLFCNFNLYHIPSYRENLKKLPAYDFFMTKIAQELVSGKNTDFINHTNIQNREFMNKWKNQDTFRDFILKEAKEIKQQEMNKFNEKSKLIEKNWLEKAKVINFKSNSQKERKQTTKALLAKIKPSAEIHTNIEYKEYRLFFNKRVSALESTIQNHQITNTNYILSPVTQAFLEKHYINTKIFENLIGNKFQQQLHSELLHIVRQSVNIWEKNPTNTSLENFVSTTIKFANLGCQANTDNKLELANSCADAGQCLLAFLRGGKNALLGTAEEFNKFVLDPFGMIGELGKNVILSTAKVAAFIENITPVNDFMITPEEEATIRTRWQGLAQSVESGTKNIKQKLANSTTLENFETTGYITTDIIFNYFIVPPIAHEVISPHLAALGTVGKEAAKLVGKTSKTGVNTTIEAIEIIQQNPCLLSGKTPFIVIEEVIEKISNFKDYCYELAKHKKLLSENEPLRKFLQKFKVPEWFIPAENSLKPLLLTDGEHYLTDILGNKLKIPISPDLPPSVKYSETGHRLFEFAETLDKKFSSTLHNSGRKNLNEILNSSPINKSIEGSLVNAEKQSIRWGLWEDMTKVTHNGREYAKIGDYLYTPHAIDRIAPSEFAELIKQKWIIRQNSLPLDKKMDAKKFAKLISEKWDARGIPLIVVEDVIENGTIISRDIVNGIEQIKKSIDKIKVIMEDNIIVSILYESK